MKYFLFAFLISASVSNAQANFAWARQLSGTSPSDLNSVVADAAGNTYLSGNFKGTVDFDPGEGVVNLTSSDPSFNDIYIVKYDAGGNLVWAKKIGGNPVSLMYFKALSLDADANILIAGTFTFDADFDPGAGIFNISAGLNASGFITKITTNGDFLWAKNYSGTDLMHINAVATDAAGNVYTTGFISGTINFDPAGSPVQITSFGSYDAYVSKHNASGDLLWAKQLGSADYDTGMNLAADAAGNIYSVGEFYGTADFDPGAAASNLTPSPFARDIYISKLDSDGDFVWAKKAGRYPNSEPQNPIAVDSEGNFYMTGRFGNTADFDLGDGTFNMTSIGGNWDVFVTKNDPDGNLVWAKQLGGAAMDYANWITVDAMSNAYLTGYFQGTADFDPSGESATLTSNGNNDIFIARLDASGEFGWVRQIGGSSDDVGRTISTDAAANVFTSGIFKNSADVNTDGGTLTFTTANFQGEPFVHKIQQSALSVNENAITKFSVFPNPSTGSFTVASSSGMPFEVSVHSLYGQLLYKVPSDESHSIVLAPGVYFVSTGSATAMKLIVH